MPQNFVQLKSHLLTNQYAWLVTGVAGFIGSNILEELLKLNQKVVGLDNISTGRESNLQKVEKIVGDKAWKNFRFIRGDIREKQVCEEACRGADYVLHQAALGSVVRSVTDPLSTHQVNVDGFMNMLLAARDASVKSFVYASSSSVYGDNQDLPKKEELIGNPLSPYAASKRVNEIYAAVFSSLFNLNTAGLRYFNVFGPRQDPESAYAAVIPRWISTLLKAETCTIFGDGTTSRDFCYVSNVVSANLLAAVNVTANTEQKVFNVGVNNTTCLNDLFAMIVEKVNRIYKISVVPKAVYAPARLGDISHSLADISAARNVLGYHADISVSEGLEIMIPSFKADS